MRKRDPISIPIPFAARRADDRRVWEVGITPPPSSEMAAPPRIGLR